MEPISKGERVRQWLKETALEELTHTQKIEREILKMKALWTKGGGKTPPP
jgi:hypothetical protein